MLPDQIALDKGSAVPLAEQIATQVLNRILAGELDAGEKLPAERDLAEQLGISRGTVKRALARLEEQGAIEIRQGSGSYVMQGSRMLEESQKKVAADLIVGTLDRLRAMGLSDKEIRNLVNLSLTAGEQTRKLAVIVLSNNHEILAELEQQLNYLTSTSQFSFTLSFMTLGSVEQSGNPLQMLFNYDLIIATSIDYPDLLELAPMYRHKMVEAQISPRTSTLLRLSELDKGRGVGIVYRTAVFRDIVGRTLHSLGFPAASVHAWQEQGYDPARHLTPDIGAVIGFNEAPMFVDGPMADRHKQFVQNGGRLLRFEYRIDRSSLTFIEDRIQDLLTQQDAQ